MSLVDRVREHAVLAIAEGLLTSLATLGVAFGVVVAGGTVVGIRTAGVSFGVDQSLVAIATTAVAVLPLVGSLCVPFFAVAEYRRFFDRHGSRAVAAAGVPLVGLVGPVAVLVLGDPGPLGPGLVVACVVSAHLLALRILGYLSRNSPGRTRQLVGVVGTVPLSVSLISIVTDRFVDGGVAAAGRVLAATPGWQSIPGDPLFLATFPLSVVVLHTGLGSLERDHRVALEIPGGGSFEHPGRWLDERRRRIRERSASLSRSLSARFHAGLRRLFGRRGGSTGDETYGGPPVPTPPQSSSATTETSGETDPGTSSDPRTPPSPDPADGASTAGGSADDNGTDGPEEPESPMEGSADDAQIENDASGSSDDGTTPALTSAVEASADATDEPEDDDSNSDTVTRIYSGEFEDPTGTSVETCPECEEDLPSDGSFEFCPLCGNELP